MQRYRSDSGLCEAACRDSRHGHVGSADGGTRTRRERAMTVLEEHFTTPPAEALARVCAEEPQIRARLESAGDASPLDRLIAVVRDGGELTGPLDELHAVLRAAPHAEGRGSARRGGGFRGVRPMGMGDPRPVEVVFLCPRGSCSRRWQPDPVASPTPPACLVHGEPLLWERL